MRREIGPPPHLPSLFGKLKRTLYPFKAQKDTEEAVECWPGDMTSPDLFWPLFLRDRFVPFVVSHSRNQLTLHFD